MEKQIKLGVRNMESLRKKKVAKMESSYVLQQEKKAHTHKKKKRGLIRRLTFYGICFALLSVLATFTLISQAVTIEAKMEEKEKVQQEMVQLKKEETLLKEEIVKLNDDDYIAKLARRDYFLSEEGEIIFNLPKQDEDSD
jgi:cell division protein DivIC